MIAMREADEAGIKACLSRFLISFCMFDFDNAIFISMKMKERHMIQRRHALFSMGEIDPGFGNRSVLLAYEQDGQPLPTTDGAVRCASWCPAT